MRSKHLAHAHFTHPLTPALSLVGEREEGGTNHIEAL